jgi:hypothetical protein
VSDPAASTEAPFRAVISCRSEMQGRTPNVRKMLSVSIGSIQYTVYIYGVAGGMAIGSANRFIRREPDPLPHDLACG